MTNENRLLESLTKQSCVFFLFMLLSSIFITKFNDQQIFADYKNEQNQDLFGEKNVIKRYEEDTWKNEKEHDTTEIKKKLGKNYVRIKKNQDELFSFDFIEYNI